ncbi:B12-binding domain-containing protein [Candidatus Bathyarchaeota archaeon]|nr:B12-binding domain-containing protein [Candidatus Bathyarchaeota archaeon]
MVEKGLKADEDPFKTLEDVRRVMEIVGDKFAESEYFISDLLFVGKVLRAITEKIKPRLAGKGEAKLLGKVIIETVAKDIHYIGPKMVGFKHEAKGFEVYDLGVDAHQRNS